MHTAPIVSGYRYGIRNDHVCLDRFSSRISEMQSGLDTTVHHLKESLEKLNDKGFADRNFKNLYDVLIHNAENIKKLDMMMGKLKAHIDGLSLLIKEYENVEI